MWNVYTYKKPDTLQKARQFPLRFYIQKDRHFTLRDFSWKFWNWHSYTKSITLCITWRFHIQPHGRLSNRWYVLATVEKEWKAMWVEGGYNIFLPPTHNWMHDCIRDWTQKWDPALMTSIVWPNHCQGIIIMSSGGTVGRLREPAPRRRGTKVKDSTLLRIFEGLNVFCQRFLKSRLCLCSSLATA